MGQIYFDDWKPRTEKNQHTDKNDFYEVVFSRRVERARQDGTIETVLIKTDPPLLADHETFMNLIKGVDVQKIDWKQWVPATKADKAAAKAANEPEPKGKFVKSLSPAQLLMAAGKQ